MGTWVASAADASHDGVDPRLATGRLTIDLDALAANWRLLAARAVPARVAGVVKADAYGLGVAKVAPVLWREGCRDFFVALPHEGIALRKVLPEATIYVLSGPLSAEAAPALAAHRLVPVLNSPHDLSTWEAYGYDGDVPRPCAIHVDTGMNRLGLTHAEAHAFAQENALTGALTPLLVMSHLACADQPDHAMNRRQAESFQAVARAFGDIESSLANSSGTFLGPDFAFDLVRPGIALYGGAPHEPAENSMRPVVTAEARILQVRAVAAGETVGYGASVTLARDSLVAIAGVGYADGFHRAGSPTGVALHAAAPGTGRGFLHGRHVRLLGRISMDLTAFDVTELGWDRVAAGDWIELFGENVAIDEAATSAGTIAYELLTGLGRRYCRHYVRGGGTSRDD